MPELHGPLGCGLRHRDPKNAKFIAGRARVFLNARRQGRTDLPNLRQILQVSGICFGGDPDYLIGEFSGGCTAADSASILMVLHTDVADE